MNKARNALIALAALLVLGLVAAGPASAKDRNHDKIPDRWEKRHNLSLKVNQAKRDQDRDQLNNRGEFKSGSDPRDDDTDDDGVEDGDENAGVISVVRRHDADDRPRQRRLDHRHRRREHRGQVRRRVRPGRRGQLGPERQLRPRFERRRPSDHGDDDPAGTTTPPTTTTPTTRTPNDEDSDDSDERAIARSPISPSESRSTRPRSSVGERRCRLRGDRARKVVGTQGPGTRRAPPGALRRSGVSRRGAARRPSGSARGGWRAGACGVPR